MKGIAISVNAIRIRLTEERWFHIVQNHPELLAYKKQIIETLENPDKVFKGKQEELIAIRKYTHYLAVIYKEEKDDGFVITAFIARKLSSIGKLKTVWNKES